MHAAAKLFLSLVYCLPLQHLQLTSGFGYRLHPLYGVVRLHAGIDLAARHDTVFAVMDGAVSACRYDAGLGLFVRVAHAGSLESVYGHLSQWLVMPGDSVRAGEAIGMSGATGAVTGEHLHFAMLFKQHYIDPLRFLRMVILNNTLKNPISDEQTK